MSTHHLLLPGLGSTHLEGGWLQSVHRHPLRQQARLVHAFGVGIAAVEATLLTGVPPREHGVLFDDDAPRCESRIAPWHRRDDTLLTIDTFGGQVRALDRLLDELLDPVGDDELVLVSSAPAGRAADRVVELPASALGASGLRLRVEPGFALCVATTPAARLGEQLRATLLSIEGVERILDPAGESAGAWMAPVDRGWILLPEPGYRFAGPHQAPAPGTPVLLGFGPQWMRAWPDAVHDWRVAPTLLAALGREVGDCFDAPLEGSAALRG